MTPQRAMPSGRVARRLPSLALAVLLGLGLTGLSGCTSVQEGYARLVEAFRGTGQTGQASGDATPGDKATSGESGSTPINKPAGTGGTPINRTPPPADDDAGTGSTPINKPAATTGPAPTASSGASPAAPAGAATPTGTGGSGGTPATTTTAAPAPPSAAAPPAAGAVTTAGSGGTPINKPSPAPTTAPKDASAEEAKAQEEDPNGPMSQTPGADRTLRVGLNIQHLGIGIPLPTFGKNLAVVPAPDGHRCVGLNGVNESTVAFKGKHFRNFKIEAQMNYNYPYQEGTTFKRHLLTMRLGDSAERSFDVTISQGEAEPPMAVFSVSGPALAPDMFCSPKPIRWREDMPDATTHLRIKKEAGSIRFEYDDQLVCTSPLDPNLTLTGFSVPLTGNARVYDMALILLPDTPPTAEAAKGTAGAPGAGTKASGAADGSTAINGRGATEEAQEEPFPAAEIARADGLTHIDLKRLSTGSPVGGIGKNLIVLDDEEGKYVASASPQGSYVLLPAATGKNFTVSILIKNAFVLSERTGRTDHFFLFRVNYKNGVKELYTTDITRPSNILYRNRYYISRSGPDMMGWTAATDYRPWNNALDFNEYKIIKEKNLLRFFFNGEFIRSERTMGDVLESVKVDLREHERLYDIRVQDTDEAGPKHVHPWHTLDDDTGKTATPTAPAKGKKP